jgi:hypothetical protein
MIKLTKTCCPADVDVCVDIWIEDIIWKKKNQYIVIGDIVPNTDMNKYKINSKDIEQIDISVLNVNQNDSGIYQSVSLSESSNVDGCCLLIITGLHILLYFCMFKKYMWRNRFFNFSNYLDEGSARMLEAILRTCDGSI